MNHGASRKPLYNLAVRFHSWESGVASGEHGSVQNLMLAQAATCRGAPGGGRVTDGAGAGAPASWR